MQQHHDQINTQFQNMQQHQEQLHMQQQMQQGANKPLAVAVPYRGDDPEAKEHYDDITDDPGYRAESQCLGYSLMVISHLFTYLWLWGCARSLFQEKHDCILVGSFWFRSWSCFWIIVFMIRNFSAASLLPTNFCLCCFPIFSSFHRSLLLSKTIRLQRFWRIVIALIQYFVLFQDDTTESGWLMFKPWVYEKLWSVVFIGNLSSNGQVSDQPQPAPYQSAPYQAAPVPYMGQSYPNPSYPANSYPPPPQYSQAQANTISSGTSEQVLRHF